MHRTQSERLKKIQKKLGVEPDGLLGAQTLSALEKHLFDSPDLVVTPQSPSLTLSSKGIAAIVAYEVGSKNYYNLKLRQPCWPGGDSGLTIGVGYDLGFASTDQFQQDWAAALSTAKLDRLSTMCGKKGRAVKDTLSQFSDIGISYKQAVTVFSETSLPNYASQAAKAFPGLKALYADAQAALVSLVYNRGPSMRGDARIEMRAIRDLVPELDYAGIAEQLRLMKRLWEGRNLQGLLTRREDEALLIENADRHYDTAELISI